MKMKFLSVSFLLILSAFTFLSCSGDDPAAPVETGYALEGKVTDASGNPVSNADIHYIPQLASYSLPKTSEIAGSEIVIWYSLPRETSVTVSILENITLKTLHYIVNNQVRSAGNHIVVFDAANLPNGVYNSEIRYDAKVIRNKILLSREPSELENAGPYAVSDAKGNFRMDYKKLGIGEKFDFHTDVSPNAIGRKEITDSLRLFITRTGYKNVTETFKVSTDESLKKTFILQVN